MKVGIRAPIPIETGGKMCSAEGKVEVEMKVRSKIRATSKAGRVVTPLPRSHSSTDETLASMTPAAHASGGGLYVDNTDQSCSHALAVIM
eukprot:2877650-Pleurochrysis_carterae.AAC.1